MRSGAGGATEIGRRHLVDEAASWGMPGPEASDVVSATLAALGQGIESATVRYPAAPEEMRDAVAQQIRRLAASP